VPFLSSGLDTSIFVVCFQKPRISRRRDLVAPIIVPTCRSNSRRQHRTRCRRADASRGTRVVYILQPFVLQDRGVCRADASLTLIVLGGSAAVSRIIKRASILPAPFCLSQRFSHYTSLYLVHYTPSALESMHSGYFQHYHHHHRRFGMFRRFFWFGFGAFTATVVARHYGHQRFASDNGHRRDGDWGCRRVEYRPNLVPGPPPQSAKEIVPLVQAVTGKTQLALVSPTPGTIVPPIEHHLQSNGQEIGRNAGERVSCIPRFDSMRWYLEQATDD
jgi:hypothetical protein